MALLDSVSEYAHLASKLAGAIDLAWIASLELLYAELMSHLSAKLASDSTLISTKLSK